MRSETVEIPLTHGKIAIIDASDYAKVAPFKWLAVKSYKNLWYAYRSTTKDERRREPKRIKMLHRHILDSPKGIKIDHKNHDGLDCRRSNMRFATNQQNSANSRLASNNTSGYRGVSREGAKWRAAIKSYGKPYRLGLFSSAEDAAKAYDKKAFELFREFAYQNFPLKVIEGGE